MKNKKFNKWIIVLIIVAFAIICADKNTENEYIDIYKNKTEIVDIFSNDKEIDFDINDIHATIDILEDGYDIYTCNGYGYRYGPSIIYYDDGSLDVWLSSPGNNSTEWDYIRYMHSDDGINWSNEKIVLKPTKSSLDHYSVCDPGIIYFNGYYYLGYTSTTNADGKDNDVFVARSVDPDGPYEKWNGNGWGGDPYPIIEFDGTSDYWGAGEISFCIKDETLYCYYSWYGQEGATTKVSTAELVDDWPDTLTYQGVAYYKNSNEDSCDVVYIEKYDKFLAVAVCKRMMSDSGVIIYESDDGINFDNVGVINENVNEYCHNIGISKKTDGSVGLSDNLYISYAYGNMGWGKWSAYIQPIELSIYVGKKK